MPNKDRKVHVQVQSTSNTMHGGLSIVSQWFWTGDVSKNSEIPEVYENQKVVLSANCNQASISLFDEAKLTPAFLRNLADELEQAPERARKAAYAIYARELTRALNGG